MPSCACMGCPHAVNCRCRCPECGAQAAAWFQRIQRDGQERLDRAGKLREAARVCREEGLNRYADALEHRARKIVRDGGYLADLWLR